MTFFWIETPTIHRVIPFGVDLDYPSDVILHMCETQWRLHYISFSFSEKYKITKLEKTIILNFESKNLKIIKTT